MKDRFEQQYGTKLSYLPFVLRAAVAALKARPLVNASIVGDDDRLPPRGEPRHRRRARLGPHRARSSAARTTSRSWASRAPRTTWPRGRARRSSCPDEVAGGTFTVTNHGSFGSLFATPVINQPQVAIMGVGAIEKRAKVVEMPDGSDSIAIKTMGYIALTFDHRLIDGAEGDAFVNVVKATLENGTRGASWSRIG